MALARRPRKQNGKAATRRSAPTPVPRPKGPAIPLPVLLERLQSMWPDAHCELAFENAYQLLVATILSAQCTDVRVNMTTPALFKKYPTPAALAAAKPAQLEKMIKSTGFYRNKTKSLLGAAKRIVEAYGGEVPDSMESLLTLPGVARKTASVVLGNAFHKNEGIAVDTHVTRLMQRWGLTKESDPPKIEKELLALLPRDRWTSFSHQTIFHGRRTCQARKPLCAECPLNDLCPSASLVRD